MIDTEDASLKNVRFYTTEKLSGKTARTPEGFLLCTDVVIARTGQQLYAPGETPVEPGPDGIVKIEREADEVFRPETIASFNGKPLVNEHPDEDVNPTNWKYLSIGVVMSPRRGTATQDDLLLADLLITDENGIEEVLEGKRELSCGYDCDYDQFEPGHGRQYNIIGNHVALVHSARCGSRCSIRDSAANGGEMADKKCFKDKIRELFKTKDSKPEQLEELLKDVRTTDEEGAGGGGIHLHMASGGSGEGNRSKYTDEKLDELFGKYDKQHESHDSRLKAHDEDIKALRGNGEGEEEEEKEGAGKKDKEKEIEGELEEEAPEGTGDKARKAKDSNYLVESFQETVTAAEILAPGVKVPTFDKAAKPLESYTNICKFRAKVLGKALEDEETAELIIQANRGKTLDAALLKTMDCGSLRTLFFAAAAMKKAANNSGSRTNDDEIRTAGGGLGVRSKMKSPADLNKRNQEFYSRTH